MSEMIEEFDLVRGAVAGSDRLQRSWSLAFEDRPCYVSGFIIENLPSSEQCL
jgi:hypothetical protein